MIAKFAGTVVGYLLTEQALSLWILAGRFDFTLIWILAKVCASKRS